MRYTIRNRQGLNIVLLYNQAPNPKGLAFVQHGLSGYKEQQHIETITEAFHAHGISTVTFDATHSFGESDGDLFNACLTNHAHDLEDIVKWVKTQPWFHTPFYLAGHSLGGASVLLYAQRYSHDVRAVFPASSVISGTFWQEAHTQDYIQAWKEKGYIEKTSTSRPGAQGRIGWNYVQDLLNYDLLANVKEMSTPALFVVGSLDTSTPPYQQRALFNSWGGDKEYHEIEGSGHTFKSSEHLSELRRITDAWIQKIEKS